MTSEQESVASWSRQYCSSVDKRDPIVHQLLLKNPQPSTLRDTIISVISCYKSCIVYTMSLTNRRNNVS